MNDVNEMELQLFCDVMHALFCQTLYVNYFDVCVMMGSCTFVCIYQSMWYVVICDDMKHVNLNLYVLSI